MRLIVMGALFMMGGLSGSFVLKGTGSSGALALVGLVMLVIGIISVGKAREGGDQFESSLAAQPTEYERERDAEQMAEYRKARLEQAKKAQAAEQARARVAATEELARPWAPDPSDPRAQRLEAIYLVAPAAREHVAQVLGAARAHLDADAQLNLALETARRVRDGARA
ncbi:MAG: hypothetical protein JNK82_43050 [Myxococcaceae bacterium]|nr:hypothetical protein [Myxococcaceae bacterium]